MPTITQSFTAADARGDVMSAIRAYESGSAAGNYSAVNGDAYGAYQMLAGALQTAGAITSASVGVNVASNWTGKLGTSLSNFLDTPSLQDAAAAKYLNYVAGQMNSTGASDQIGSSFSEGGISIPITEDGLLVAGWLTPGWAAQLATGETYTGNKSLLSDFYSRFQTGALLENVPVSDPSSKASLKNSQVDNYLAGNGKSTGTGIPGTVGSGGGGDGGASGGDGVPGTGTGGGDGVFGSGGGDGDSEEPAEVSSINNGTFQRSQPSLATDQRVNSAAIGSAVQLSPILGNRLSTASTTSSAASGGARAEAPNAQAFTHSLSTYLAREGVASDSLTKTHDVAEHIQLAGSS